MLTLTRGLTGAELDDIAALEARVLAADGGRLKLEPQVLAGRSGERVDDVLVHENGRLVGFLGIYDFGDIELSGMVDPAARRRGHGAALLDAAFTECRSRAAASVLLVVPRTSEGGRALALRRGGALGHSEHALLLEGPPPDGPVEEGLLLRPVRDGDQAAVLELLASGFGSAGPDHAALVEQTWADTLVAEREGLPVATVRATLDGDRGGVYGFVVRPELRGHGLGRDVLRRTCIRLRASGASVVGLEVSVDNEGAVGLYTSLGFRPVATEDYYALLL